MLSREESATAAVAADSPTITEAEEDDLGQEEPPVDRKCASNSRMENAIVEIAADSLMKEVPEEEEAEVKPPFTGCILL